MKLYMRDLNIAEYLVVSFIYSEVAGQTPGAGPDFTPIEPAKPSQPATGIPGYLKQTAAEARGSRRRAGPGVLPLRIIAP
jgi:hypothetical protein